MFHPKARGRGAKRLTQGPLVATQMDSLSAIRVNTSQDDNPSNSSSIVGTNQEKPLQIHTISKFFLATFVPSPNSLPSSPSSPFTTVSPLPQSPLPMLPSTPSPSQCMGFTRQNSFRSPPPLCYPKSHSSSNMTPPLTPPNIAQSTLSASSGTNSSGINTNPMLRPSSSLNPRSRQPIPPTLLPMTPPKLRPCHVFCPASARE
jgi:hypothetical protein